MDNVDLEKNGHIVLSLQFIIIRFLVYNVIFVERYTEDKRKVIIVELP